MTQAAPWGAAQVDSNGVQVAAARAGSSVGSSTVAYGNSTATAVASSTIDDMVFSGKDPTFHVTGTLPFDIDLTRYFENWASDFNRASSGTTQEIDLSSSLGNASFDLSFDSSQSTPTPFNVNNASYTFTSISDSASLLSAVVDGVPWAGVGTSQSYFLSGELQIDTLVPTGIPITVVLSMSTTSSAGTAGGVGPSHPYSSAQTDGMETFGFPVGVPVFDLPPGYTVNAPSIGLVDNVIGGSEVPEPAYTGLFVAAFAAILARRYVMRRRTRLGSEPQVRN